MTQPPDPAPRSAILTDKEHARAIVRYGSGRAMPGEAGDDLMAETFRLLRADRAALKALLARCDERLNAFGHRSECAYYDEGNRPCSCPNGPLLADLAAALEPPRG